jgi:hypothetical protein
MRNYLANIKSGNVTDIPKAQAKMAALVDKT